MNAPRSSVTRIASRALAACLALTACDDAGKPEKSPAPKASGSATTAAPASAAAPTAAPSGTAKAERGIEGTWEGSYEAKKLKVSLPPKVKDKALAADDGKKASGPGTIEMTVTAGGEVRGKIKGALGPGSLTGRIDEGEIHVSINADDPRADEAMSGVLQGSLKGDVFEAEIHVSGRDATVVRETKVELKRK